MPGVRPLQRSLALPGEPASPGSARRFLRELLEAAGRTEWADAAELAVSELVTNAVLHAHSQVQLTARVEPDHMRVEVHDGSSTLPAQKDYDSHATTGRGLDLVAAVTSAHGVEGLTGGGKVVWFSVRGDRDTLTVDDLLGQWEDVDVDLPDEPASVPVVLRDMPPTLWLAAREHHDAVLRELALYLAGHQPPARDGGATDLAAADRARFMISGAVAAEVDRARQQGSATPPVPQYHPGNLPSVPDAFDLALRLSPQDGRDFAALQDALDEGERLAAAERLLVHPGLPEIIAVRDWACEQVIAQLAGAPGAGWTGADDDRFVRDVRPGDLASSQAWDAGLVSDAAGGAVAVDVADRIVSISRSLAEQLGWRPEDLVGRRVVAIIPPRFREAHVAGFSRHLSTGDTRVIGTGLTLPVLRADGSELVCRLSIERHPSPGGRPVFVGWITPLHDDG